MGQGLGNTGGGVGVRQNSYFFFLQKRRKHFGGMSEGIAMAMFKNSDSASFRVSSVLRLL